MPHSQPADCSAATDRLQARLDGDYSPLPGTVQLHLDACPTCRERFRAADRLLSVLNAAPPRPFTLTDCVVTAVRRDTAHRRRVRKALWSGGAAIAAGVSFWLTTRPPKPGDLAPVSPTPPLVASTAVPSLDVVEVGAVASLPLRTAVGLAERGRLLLPDVAIPATLPTVEGKSRPLDEARNGLAESFEPVTASARRTFGLLSAFAVDRRPDPAPRDETRQ